jgi:RNA polymerase sigma-70 factor, ECF subfamily
MAQLPIGSVPRQRGLPGAGASLVARPYRDDESCGWLRALSGPAPESEAAAERLHALLLQAARYEIIRRQRAGGTASRSRELDDFAMLAADDALAAILRKLPTYRGDSRFTTWAYKFALLEAAAVLRKRTWRGREVALDSEGWARLPDARGPSPAGQAETHEVLGVLRDAIAQELTPHQRAVLVAITLDDVPIDVLADRLGTTRGAVYKTLYDARRKLRARLTDDGLA